MKAAIALDDYKLPVFRKRLTEAGYKYTDAGEFTPGTTVLTVEYEIVGPLAALIQECNNECARQQR